MNIQPTNDNVYIQVDTGNKTLPSGLVLPSEIKPETGKVLAIGSKCKFCRVDDTVYYGKFGGDEIEIDGKKMMFIKESQILAVKRD